MSYRLLLLAVLLVLAFVDPALANWWIVRAADGKCLVVDIEPSGKDITKVGKDVYEFTRAGRSRRQKGLQRKPASAHSQLRPLQLLIRA